MCDTFVALPDATADGSLIFAKNSDREPNEAHELLHLPSASHPTGSRVKLTYVDIPQVTQTRAILLARPFWIWGAEMGANDQGVVIGNEALFTKVPHEPGPGLIGMDLLRLGLERADTAPAALRVITDLLERHGQGGDCGFAHPLVYHNSFLIADPQEAWVLETAGRHWVAQRVTGGVRSISNAPTIGQTWDLASAGLVDYAVAQGWCRGRQDFHFARCYADLTPAPSMSFLYTRFSDAQRRQRCTSRRLAAQAGRLTVADAMALLRHHDSADDRAWTPARGLAGADLCMHAGFGPVRVSQSVGSLVSHLTPNRHTHWLTGTSAPCTGIFKPVWLDAGLPDTGPAPSGRYDEASLWWRHEALHRAVLRDYAARLPHYRPQRDDLEASFMAAAAARLDRPAGERAVLSARCFAQAEEAAGRWRAQVQAQPVANRRPWLHALAWRRFNHQAAFAKVAGRQPLG